MSELIGYKKYTPEELLLCPITQIGKQWALVTAQKPNGDLNTMTVAWGGIGVLFYKPVAFVFIRPQRYTKEFTDAAETVTLSFYPEQYRNALTYCGRNSGRDVDKIKETGLTPCSFGAGVAFSEAETVLVLKKLYVSELLPENFIDQAVRDAAYPQKDYHTVYIYEITEGYKKEK